MVRSDGRPTERIDKHPFQLSRVYYNEKEKGEQVGGAEAVRMISYSGEKERVVATAQVWRPKLNATHHVHLQESQAWVEPSDSLCRWTQTASEVTVLALKVRHWGP